MRECHNDKDGLFPSIFIIMMREYSNYLRSCHNNNNNNLHHNNYNNNLHAPTTSRILVLPQKAERRENGKEKRMLKGN